MLLLVFSILCSVAVSILLKVARQRQFDVAQAIAVNYVVASSLTWVLLQPQPATVFTPDTPWWILIALGVALPTIFLVMAGAVRHAGIVRSDAAQRLSLLIPLLASFLLFGEVLTTHKLAGMFVALLALVCLVHRRAASNVAASADAGETPRALWVALLLLGVWAGYGVNDVLFKRLATTGAAFPSILFTAFVLAGILIFAWLIVRRAHWDRRSMVAGLVLGLLNFGNIYFYILAHQAFSDNPTLVFTAMNIGVISLGTLVGAGVFKEVLSRVNIVGVVLAVGAIVLLIPRAS